MNTVAKKLEDKIAYLREKTQQRAQATPAPEKPSNVVPLPTMPTWADIVRGVPNSVLRSALFGVVAKGRRRFMKGEIIAALEGIQITYTGESLDQGDLDVWQCLLHLAKDSPLGDLCNVPAYTLLKLLDKKDTGGNRTVLHDRLIRLRSGTIEISNAKFSYAGGLLDEIYKDKETRHYVLKLNPKLSNLFEKNQYTLVDWELRQALSGHPLAQWLHGFYASHAQPHPMKVETLLRLAGSNDANARSALQTLCKALEVLKEVSQAHGQDFEHHIEGGLVYVNKQGSAAQQRHLAKKIRQKAAPKPLR